MQTFQKVQTFRPRSTTVTRKQSWFSSDLQRLFSRPEDFDGLSIKSLQVIDQGIATEISSLNSDIKALKGQWRQRFGAEKDYQAELRRLRARHGFLLSMKSAASAELRRLKEARRGQSNLSYGECVKQACYELLDQEQLQKVFVLAREKYRRMEAGESIDGS